MIRAPATIVALLGALLLGTANSPRPQRAAPGTLDGVWKVVAWKGPSRIGPGQGAGEIAFLRGSWIDRVNLINVRSYTIYGIYDVDFTTLGFDCRPKQGLPLAGGHEFSGDSAEVVLNPQTDHGGVTLAGRVAGDSITGTWYERREGGSSGRFVMRRQ